MLEANKLIEYLVNILAKKHEGLDDLAIRSICIKSFNAGMKHAQHVINRRLENEFYNLEDDDFAKE